MKALARWATGVVCIGVFAFAAPAVAAEKLSDKSITVLMDWAWKTLPNKFTTPEGKVIVVDRAKKDEVVVPIDVARHIIEIARLSAHAQICGLVDEQVANYQTLMRAEEQKKSWTDQQMLYIHNLHTFTVQLLAGGMKITIQENDTTIEKDSSAQNDVECSDDQKEKIRLDIKEYIESVKQASAQ